jgi:hypothetical protein
VYSPLIRLVLRSVAGALLLTLISAFPVPATTVVQMSDTDLAAQAAAVILGRVTALQSHLDAAHGRIFTDVTLAVDEVVAGPRLPATITLRQPGGRIGGIHAWIDGSPEFTIGERVLVYLRVALDGSLRVLQLYQGKLSVMIDPLTGDEVAIRINGGGVRVLAPLHPGATPPPKATHRLDDLRRLIRAARVGTLAPTRTAPIQTTPAVAGDVVQQQDAFVYMGTPSRWFEPDAGGAIAMMINSGGQAGAPTLGFDQVRAGMAAWSNDPLANFRYADGGVTTAAGMRYDGVNAVSFNDPDGAMDPPVNCSGTLAMGGFFRSTTESRVVNGTTFMRILDGDVVVNDGWQGCGFYESFTNFAEVATHELGHVLGLGHSTDTTATMYATAHFDGRGASLKADDLAGLRSIYPASGPTLAFAAPANGATVSGTTMISLNVTGGAAPYTYEIRLDGAVLANTASFAWNTTTTADGAHMLTASVTDAAGHAATASISVTVSNGGGAGALRVAITQPSPGATVSGVSWAVIWVEGTSGASNTFTLTLAGQPMGTTTSSSRGPISMPYDTRSVANGAQPLAATVRDAAGNTGSTTLTVIVSNGNAPPPLTASFTSPAAGATVSGTVSVGMTASGGTPPYTYTLTLDGAQLVSGSSTTFSWNSTSAGNGSHSLGLTVRDSAGATATATRAVSVQNGAPSPPPPPPPPPPTGSLKVYITSPSNGATLSGTGWVTLWLEGASGGANTYTLTVGGQTVATTTTASMGPVSMAWSTTAVADGTQTLTASARDATGNTGAASITVTVANGGGAPQPPPPPPPTGGSLGVFITSPSSGATVNGTVWVNIWVERAAAGNKVFTLRAGNTVVGTTTDSGVHVTLAWDTPGTPNGGTTLSATVQDATGASGSTSIPVTVGN